MSNDIGDDVTVTTAIRIDGVLTDPATVTLAVTDPTGEAIAPPAVTNTSDGVYEAVVAATLAGRWRYTWTTTAPAGVEHGFFDVAANPPPPGRLDPLAGISDLEDRLGRALTDTEARRAASLLADASALVRSYTRQDFDLVTGDTVVLRPVGTTLTLPHRPVVAVTSVVGIGGRANIPDVTLNGWTWDGLDEIDVHGVGWRTAIDYDLELDYEGWCPESYRVLYDHGFPETPGNVVGIVCGMVNRVLLAPSPVEGMTSEQIGQYRYQMGGSAGASARLTPADKSDLDWYRRKAGTIQLRT